jgi:Cdc6-like AAA superfamily ATPase
MLPRIPFELEARIREPELRRLRGMLHPPQNLLLVGPAGTGKSVVLRHLRASISGAAEYPYVDASAPSCRTRLGLAASVMSGEDTRDSAKVHESVAAARLDGSARRTRQAIEAFSEYLQSIRGEDFYIFVDNVDQASDRALNWLIGVIQESPSVSLISTARSAAAKDRFVHIRPSPNAV